MTSQTLPLDTLSMDPMNVRRHRGEPEPEFLASLEHHGVQQALQVRPTSDGHAVFAGGKRLEGLRALANAGKIAADYPVKVEIFEGLSDADAREHSMVENFVRADMHPVDEYRGFLEIHSDKEQPFEAAAIAARFGLDLLYVEQRLALGALDDKILDAWLDDKIDENTAEAFTLCPSKKAQVAIFDGLSKKGHVGQWDVRKALKIDHEKPGRFIGFIGAEAYAARGGRVTQDLFGTNHVVSDPALVMAMVAEKLDETCKQLVADGWAFAIQPPKDQYYFGQLEGKAKAPIELTDKKKELLKRDKELSDAEDYDSDAAETVRAALEAIERQIEAVAYTAEQKKKAGVFVSVESDGSVEPSFGKVMPAEKRSAAATERKTTSAGEQLPKPSEAKVISNALAQRLDDQLVEATKKALKAEKVAAGLPAVLQKLVAGMIGGYGTPSDILKALPSIRDVITPKVMNEAIRKEFNPENYFSNAPIPVLLASITEAVSPDEARKLKGKKKSEIAKWAQANVGKTQWLPKELRTANYDGPSKSKSGK